MMAENSVVRARINERIKDEAAALLGAMGLTVSDAFRMMMMSSRSRSMTAILRSEAMRCRSSRNLGSRRPRL